MTTQSFYKIVMKTSHTDDAKVARRATAAAFHALRDRRTVDEAGQVVAQLPYELKKVWAEGESPGRQPLKINREQFYERVKREAELPSKRVARWIVLAVFAALKEQLSPGEAGDVIAQLPKDLKEVWAEAQAEV